MFVWYPRPVQRGRVHAHLIPGEGQVDFDAQFALLKEIGVPILRWPGGNFAGDYRWQDGLLDVDQRAPLPIKGEIPSPIDRPRGCVFRTRCPFMYEDCATIVPELFEPGPDHQVACIRVQRKEI